MAAGENENEGSSSSMGSPVGGSLSLAEPVACAGSSSPLLCSDAIPRDGQQSEQLCVVCHYFPLSRALLPCRHTCICAICFCKFQTFFSFDKFLAIVRKFMTHGQRLNNVGGLSPIAEDVLQVLPGLKKQINCYGRSAS